MATAGAAASSSVEPTATSSSSPKDHTVKWGIIGLGDVCQRKSGPAFYKCTGSELVAVTRRTPGKAKEFAAKVPGGNCVGYENLDDFLDHHDPNLDAVYISTRPGTHVELARKVAAAGKACYVEKPVGRCAAEAEEIQQIFRDANLPLYTAYISRAYPRTKAIRDLLKSGAIGDKLTQVSYQLVGMGGARDMDGSLPWRLDAKQSGGGLILDVGCHVLDRIDFLCGPMRDVQGTAENRYSPNIDVEDYVSLTATIGESTWADMPSEGATVDCAWDFNPNPEESVDRLTLKGPKGSLQMAGMSANGPIQVLDAEGKLVNELSFEMPEHTAQAMIQVIVDDRRGVESSSLECLSFGENAIRTQKVIDAALMSYYGDRNIGFWEDPSKWPGRPR